MNLFETGEKLARDSEKNISRQIFVKNVVVIERDDCENWNFAQKPIQPFSSKNFKTTIFTVAPFMAQISPKYFWSLDWIVMDRP